MTTDVLGLLRSVLAGCTVEPPSSFTWFGQRFRMDAPLPNGADLQAAFLRALTLHLYAHVFCPGRPRARVAAVRDHGPGEIRALLTELSSANLDRDRWEEGWRYVGQWPGGHMVERQDLRFSASRDQIQLLRGGTLRPGSDIRVLAPAERWSVSPGFLLIHGRENLPPRSAGVRRTRLYLNVDAEGARAAIALCGRLNELRVPFTLKVAADPAIYGRCDTVVLFVRRDAFPSGRQVVMEAVERGLRPRTGSPALTLGLAPGISVADDPDDGTSFGESRCGLLAEGLLRAHALCARTVDSRVEAIARVFGERGIRLDRPHLEPGSPEYDLEARASPAERG